LWSKREGVVSGLAASAALGAKWVDVDTAIELNWANNRRPIGVVTRRDTLFDDEVALLEGMAVTTADRTAFDLARRGSVGQAVARLDALARATHFKAEDVQAVAMRHPHVKGLRRVDRVLDLVDAGAESPKETWLRVLLLDEGFPRPQTQIPVLGPDGYPLYYLDMGWEDIMIAVEYDGDDHRERPRWGSDIVRSEYIAHLGWTHIRVVAGNSRPEIVQRVNRAWALR
jgi:very-short-patch-repair endonuclease